MSFENPIEPRPNKFIIESVDIERANRLFKKIDETVVDPEKRALISDPVEAQMLAAMLPELAPRMNLAVAGKGGRLRPHIDEVFALRRMRGQFFHSGYGHRMLLLAVDKQMKKLFPDEYPLRFAFPGSWRMHDVFGQLDYEELFVDMGYRNQAYNNPNGYGIFHLQTQKLKEQLKRPLVAVDIGGAASYGLMKWALNDRFPFKPMATHRMPGRNEPIGPDLEIDQEAQEVVNDLTVREPVISGAVSCDANPIAHYDEAAQNWAFSNTFLMSEEARDPAGVAQFKALQQRDPTTLYLENNIRILEFPIDARDPDFLKQLEEWLPGGKADFFILSGVIMQLSRTEIRRVLENLKPYCNEGALISVNEWAALDANEPSGLKVIREAWWHRRGAFSNFLIDPFNLDKPPFYFGSFSTRKCEEIMLSEEGRRFLVEPAT